MNISDFLKKKVKNIESYKDNNNTKSINVNTNNVKKILSDSTDVHFRNVFINASNNLPVTLLYIDGMINNGFVSDYVLKPLTESQFFKNVNDIKEAVKIILNGAIYFTSQKVQNNIDDVLSDVLSGSVALIFDELSVAITFETKGYDKRTVATSEDANTFSGSKDTFVENIRTNTSLIRQKVKSPKLKISDTIVGNLTKTTISLIYMEGITNETLVDDVKKKLQNIDVDEVLSTSFVQEYIIDNNNSLFPQVTLTERVDLFCSSISSGKVGLLVNGLSSSFILPCTLASNLNDMQDYNKNYLIATAIRILRYILIFLALILPALYISITTFHQEIIPFQLSVSMEQAKQNVPFPCFMEVSLMLIAFEILVEAGFRMPRNIGPTVSIVGGLIIGESVISAQIFSPVVVIITALAGIASFAIPNQALSNAIRFLRLVLIVCASLIGLYGIIIALIILLYHLSKLESFKVPYLTPYVENDTGEFGDSIIRLPISLMSKRKNYP